MTVQGAVRPGVAGVDFTQVDTVQGYTLGQKEQDLATGAIYRYVEADEAITQYAACFTAADWGVSELADADATVPHKVLIPQVALASGEFGWALEEGAGSVLAQGAAAAGNKLYTTDTAGEVDDAQQTGGVLVQGLKLTATNAATSTTAAIACFACGPMMVNAQD